MEPVTKSNAGAADVVEPKDLRRGAPTLYVIIVFKLGKGILAAALATLLFIQPGRLPADYDQFMGLSIVKKTLNNLRIDPENKFFTRLADRIDNTTDKGVRHAATGALLWSMFPLAEGIGMLFRVRWAGLLAIGESAFFVPLEIHHLLENFSWFMVGVAISNIIIVWYLYANRDRLFDHHLRRHRH